MDYYARGLDNWDEADIAAASALILTCRDGITNAQLLFDQYAQANSIPATLTSQ